MKYVIKSTVNRTGRVSYGRYRHSKKQAEIIAASLNKTRGWAVTHEAVPESEADNE